MEIRHLTRRCDELVLGVATGALELLEAMLRSREGFADERPIRNAVIDEVEQRLIREGLDFLRQEAHARARDKTNPSGVGVQASREHPKQARLS